MVSSLEELQVTMTVMTSEPKVILDISPRPFLNFLDKDIQRLVYSFNYALNFFMASKYNVQNSHIYPRGRKYQILAFCFMLFMIAMCFYRMFTLDRTYRNEWNESYFKHKILMVISSVFFFTFAINFFIIFIEDEMHKTNNVLLILKIQNIHRSIDCSVKNFIVWNWISIITVIALDIFFHALFYISLTYSFVVDLICDNICHLMYIASDINLVLAIRIIILLRKYLDKWIKDIQMINYEQGNQEHCLKLFEMYLKIIKAYNLFKTIFQVLVSI